MFDGGARRNLGVAIAGCSSPYPGPSSILMRHPSWRPRRRWWSPKLWTCVILAEWRPPTMMPNIGACWSVSAYTSKPRCRVDTRWSAWWFHLYIRQMNGADQVVSIPTWRHFLQYMQRLVPSHFGSLWFYPNTCTYQAITWPLVCLLNWFGAWLLFFVLFCPASTATQ